MPPNDDEHPLEEKTITVWTGEQILYSVYNDAVEVRWRIDSSATYGPPVTIPKGA